LVATGTITVAGEEQVALTGGGGAAGALPGQVAGTAGGLGGPATTLTFDVDVGNGSATLAYVLACNGLGPLGGAGFTPGGNSGTPTCTTSASGTVQCSVSGQGGGGGGSSALCLLAAGASPSACSLATSPTLTFCAGSTVPPPATCLLAVAAGGGGGGAGSVESTSGTVSPTGCPTTGIGGGQAGPVSTSQVTTVGTAQVADGYSDTGSTSGGSSPGDGGGATPLMTEATYPISGSGPYGYLGSGPGNGSWAPVDSIVADGGGGGGYAVGYAGGTSSTACGGGGGSAAWAVPGGVVAAPPSATVAQTGQPGSLVVTSLSGTIVSQEFASGDPYAPAS
jgi:hypothetical protein